MGLRFVNNLLLFVLLSLTNTAVFLILPVRLYTYTGWLFKERAWEEGGAVYQRLFKVKSWKDSMPELGDFIKSVFPKKKLASPDKAYLERYASESCRAELCHWSILLSVLLTPFWGGGADRVRMLLLAVILNFPYIIIQRYNRPRVVALIEANARKKARKRDKGGQGAGEGYTGSVLFLSADNTGFGHKSITEAVRYQIGMLDSRIQVIMIDGFSLGKRMMNAIGKLYNPIIVHLPSLWGWFYRAVNHMTRPVNAICSRIINKKLMNCIHELQPGVIISVHALFVGSVLNVLEKNKLDIPLIPLIADLDNVSGLWADKRAKYILCPTTEAKRKMLSLGIPEEKLRIVGFPVRPEFCNELPDFRREAGALSGDRVSLLMISGSQGSKQTYAMAKTLLECCDCSITIIAGNNQSLKMSLEQRLSDYTGDRVRIVGFTREMKRYMLEADILVSRASPNVLMEAVNLCKPIVVTGSLRGQEEKNPEFIDKHRLGVICDNIRELPRVINDLLSENGKKLLEICTNQKEFRKVDAAMEIAGFIVNQYSGYKDEAGT